MNDGGEALAFVIFAVAAVLSMAHAIDEPTRQGRVIGFTVSAVMALGFAWLALGDLILNLI